MIYTDYQIEKVKELYPTNYAKDIAKIIGITIEQVYRISGNLKLKKDPEFRRKEMQIQAQRLKVIGEKSRFKKGSIPINLGQKMTKETYEKCKHTMFKKGLRTHNEKFDGYERLNVEGYYEVRISKGKFKLKNRLIYEQHYKIKLAKDDVIIFADGNKYNFDITNLIKIKRYELMQKNSIHNYPTEIKQLIKLNSKLKKKINEKQN